MSRARDAGRGGWDPSRRQSPGDRVRTRRPGRRRIEGRASHPGRRAAAERRSSASVAAVRSDRKRRRWAGRIDGSRHDSRTDQRWPWQDLAERPWCDFPLEAGRSRRGESGSPGPHAAWSGTSHDPGLRGVLLDGLRTSIDVTSRVSFPFRLRISTNSSRNGPCSTVSIERTRGPAVEGSASARPTRLPLRRRGFRPERTTSTSGSTWR